MIRIENASQRSVLATQAELAATMSTRMKGLLGRKELPEGTGLIIDPCNSIHTFFMQFPIDVIFADAEDRVVQVLKNMGPWRLSWIYFRAQKVIELPAGTLTRVPVSPGDQLILSDSAASG